MRSEQFSPGERPIAQAAHGRRIGERELIWMMALLMACNAFGIDAILPALDALAVDFGAEGNSRQFVVGAYLFAAGLAGERFAVRNSGDIVVIDGCGSYGCEYMTGGTAVILGDVGDNFAAGMTGGMAFIYDKSKEF